MRGQKAIAGFDGKLALVIQALRYLAKGGVGNLEIGKLKSSLSATEKRKLLKDSRYGADWIYEATKKIAEKIA